MKAGAGQPLLDRALMARLERLELVVRRIHSRKLGADWAGRRPARGAALLPVDYRDYSPGDEERFIDWNVYARLDRLVVKLFAEEEDFFVHLLVDVSASCDYGAPDKGLYLRRAAAALGYVGLANSRHVSVAAFADRILADSGVMRGRARTAEMIGFLSGDGFSGSRRATGFAESCRQFLRRRRHRGMCVVLSDFLFRGGLDEGLDCLDAAGHDLLCVQVLSPQELRPELGEANDRVELIDAEGGGELSVTAGSDVLARYRANLELVRGRVKAAVERRGGRFLSVSTEVPMDRLVLQEMRMQGILG